MSSSVTVGLCKDKESRTELSLSLLYNYRIQETYELYTTAPRVTVTADLGLAAVVSSSLLFYESKIWRDCLSSARGTYQKRDEGC